MRTLDHNQSVRCPRCRRNAYCDDCAACSECGFAAPDVEIEQPPPPAPKRCCPECGRPSAHSIKCDNCVAKGATFHCVWATTHEQSRNKRNNVFFVYGERRLCAADWARVFGIHPSDLARRVRRNSVDVAFDAYCMERGVDRDAIRRKE